MKSTVAIYDSHRTAIDAIEVLKNKSYPVNLVSVLGQAKIVDEDIQLESNQLSNNLSVSFGVVLDSTLAALSGARILCIKGLGFVFCAGKITTSITGFYIGFSGLGIAAILSSAGIKNNRADACCKYLNEGKYLVIAQGNKKEIERNPPIT